MIVKDIAKADRKLLLICNDHYLICNDKEKLCSLNFTQNLSAYVVANDADQFILNCLGSVLYIPKSIVEMSTEDVIVFCLETNQLNEITFILCLKLFFICPNNMIISMSTQSNSFLPTQHHNPQQ